MAAIGEFLAEDIGRGDITTKATVPPDTRGIGRFLAKEYLVPVSYTHLDVYKRQSLNWPRSSRKDLVENPAV